MIKPALPSVGDSVKVLGIDAEVVAVEPHSDWFWNIVLRSVNAAGANEEWYVRLPTDFRTTDGLFLNDHPFFIRDDCALCGEGLDDESAEFLTDDGTTVIAHSSCALERGYVQS